MSIVLVDTSVFCNLLGVPDRSQDRERATAELRDLIQANDTLLLPLATIYETGNHIAHHGTGAERRSTAGLFVKQIRQAFAGNAPWSPTPIDDEQDLLQWLNEFPDSAMRGIGLGDLSIIQLFEKQCELHPRRRVRIWSYDKHLSSYDRLV